MAPTPEAAAADGRAFLQACAPALVGTLVLCQREADLGLLALSLGTGGAAPGPAGRADGASMLVVGMPLCSVLPFKICTDSCHLS